MTDKRRREEQSDQGRREAELYEQIGRVKLELEWLKKTLSETRDARRQCIDPGHPPLSLRRQCDRVGLNRSTWYSQPVPESAEMTSLPMKRGFLYLIASIDWFSRYVLAWRVSKTLEGDCCRESVAEAFEQGHPEMFTTDQGVQFTAQAFTALIEAAGVRMSMDGRGRALDNVCVERLWRSVKYEEVY